MVGRNSLSGSIWIAVTITLLATNVYLQVAEGATFTVNNQCRYTVWAAASPGGGQRLEYGQTWTFNVAPKTKRARIWARTGCSFDGSRRACTTGDCGGLLYCQGYGSPPATLFEYSLNQPSNLDYYDISLVEGFNIPLSVTPSNSNCAKIGCPSNINPMCPSELKVRDGCKSACIAFNQPKYCCTNQYQDHCAPTYYSRFFKAQCPQAYSYAKDDVTSTFTCAGGGNYNVVFCG